ncbi:hypothetical protein FCM35_KLT01286 [Carex littledalei]|uniref:Haloacid dehalogenase-like hydrolase superfamily protein n=1 Tax=Carex littledalei TaxID=544730 RepID=A0A833QVF9_9POAL|nr:hypothetical protein FCM35_KLT01286 [Carex littledalei]
MNPSLIMRSTSSFSPPFVPARPPLPATHLSSHLCLSKWKCISVGRRKLVVRNALSGGQERENGADGFSSLPNNIFSQEAIGAEYGEGFETFRTDGPLKVDVDYLNNKLQQCFLQKIRHAMKPDEAFGLIFSWDNVVVDTHSVKLAAWRQLASEEGKEMPNSEHLQRNMLRLSADHVLAKVLFWAKEETEIERLKSRLYDFYYENLQKVDVPVKGLKEWLDAVYTARIPCAVVSCLDRRYMVEALQRMGLKKYFRAIVTQEDGMESIAHRFLSAAVKLDRKPSKCVVFEDDLRGITASHNCTMMAVALIGAHRAYELVQADLAVAKYSELSVINLRRLFASRGTKFMDLQKKIIDKSPPKRKLTMDTI